MNGGGPGANPYIDSGNPSKVIMAAKAGAAGVRPRPIKRQRMVSHDTGFPAVASSDGSCVLMLFTRIQDVQGQAMDVTAVQQQPTPQGV